MGEYNVNPGIDWGKVIPMLQWERGVQADRQAQEEQAIRWQGEQDYKTLVDSGVDPMESFRRTAPKLFHNDPRGFASAMESMRRRTPEGDPITKQLNDGTTAMWTGNTWVVVPRERVDPASFADFIEQLPDGSTVKRKIPISEVGKIKADKDASMQSRVLKTQESMGPGGVKGMWNKFWGNPPAAAPVAAPAAAQGLAQMPSVTTTQAQAEIQRRAPVPPSTSTAPDAIRNAYRAGKITESEAARLLKDQHGFK